MRGREERDEQKREMTKRKLEGYPAYMQGYFNYLYDKTENTKYNYITNVTYYLSYLKKNGKDISNLKIFNKTKPSDINTFIYGLNGKDAKKLLDRLRSSVKLSCNQLFLDVFKVVDHTLPGLVSTAD